MEVKRLKVPKEYELNIQDKTPEGYARKFFAQTCCGSSRAGKSTYLIHMISQIANCYSTVVIFSPSADDPSWTALRKFPNVYMSNMISNNILHELFLRQQKYYQQDKAKNHMLLVLDDFGILAKENGKPIGVPPKEPEIVSSGIRQMLDLLYSRARHNGMSIVSSYHDTKQMSPLQRVNTTQWVLYRLNQKQYEKIAGEIRAHLSEKEFVDLADKYTKEPYHALYVDLKAPDNKDVFKQLKPASQ